MFFMTFEKTILHLGGYMDFGDYQIICASPERFLKMKDRHVNTRPIKGTRKRGATLEEDEMLRKELEIPEKIKVSF